MSALHRGTAWDSAGTCQGHGGEQTAHPLPASLLAGVCQAVWKQPSCLFYGTSTWEEGKERKVVPSREMCNHSVEIGKSLAWCDRVFIRAARNGLFWHGDVVVTLVPVGALHSGPGCHCPGPNFVAATASLTSAAAAPGGGCAPLGTPSCPRLRASCTPSPPLPLNVIVEPPLVPSRALKRG